MGVLCCVNMGLACSTLLSRSCQKGGSRSALNPLKRPRVRCPITWKPVVPAALHIQSCQIQPDPSHLLKQLVPELIHQHGVLPVQLSGGGHETSEDRVDATWVHETKELANLLGTPKVIP